MRRAQAQSNEDQDNHRDSCNRLDFLRDVAIQQLALLSSQVQAQSAQYESHKPKPLYTTMNPAMEDPLKGDRIHTRNQNTTNSLLIHGESNVPKRVGTRNYSVSNDKAESTDNDSNGEKKTLRKGKWTVSLFWTDGDVMSCFTIRCTFF
jgi:hypothetical protein